MLGALWCWLFHSKHMDPTADEWVGFAEVIRSAWCRKCNRWRDA
jgi:hypothetical protein